MELREVEDCSQRTWFSVSPHSLVLVCGEKLLTVQLAAYVFIIYRVIRIRITTRRRHADKLTTDYINWCEKLYSYAFIKDEEQGMNFERGGEVWTRSADPPQIKLYVQGLLSLGQYPAHGFTLRTHTL